MHGGLTNPDVNTLLTGLAGGSPGLVLRARYTVSASPDPPAPKIEYGMPCV